MDLKNLSTFIQVAELSSFTKAAEKLGYSQSTVSFQIKQMEQELGLPLFERINHTVELTEHGARLLRSANEIEAILREFTHEEAEPVGKVRLATSDSLCLATVSQMFSRLRKEYPGITLEIITAGTQEMFRLVNHNEVDLLYTLDSHIYDADYVIVEERRIPVRFVAAANHPLTKKKKITLRELIDQPLLLTEKGMSYRRLLDEELARKSLAVQPALESSNTDLLCSLARQGEGIALLPEFTYRREVAEGHLAELSVPEASIEVWAQLLHHRDKWVGKPLELVMNALKRCEF